MSTGARSRPCLQPAGSVFVSFGADECFDASATSPIQCPPPALCVLCASARSFFLAQRPLRPQRWPTVRFHPPNVKGERPPPTGTVERTWQPRTAAHRGAEMRGGGSSPPFLVGLSSHQTHIHR